ncbi:ATP-binding protein [Pelobacter seleniigenes]|uniref:ATP-binding protein n=1 Tax=Pelobacter seleniigenes TaxID=407188 RepID=UPI00068CAC35|nr:ATP-binding protein [Pelobacter seleniigenes]
MRSSAHKKHFTAGTITLFFFILSCGWALLSDQLFAVLLNKPNLVSNSINLGHWFFIVISTILLFWMLTYWETAIEETQKTLHRVNRSLRSISECSRAITRIEDEEKLMQEICRICVEVGGHSMAWVAFKQNNPEKSLRSAAHWGADTDYLDNLQASWAPETDIGLGPAGTCIRTGEAVIFNNLAAEARFAPWLNRVKKYGYASCIALPLHNGTEVFGALVIFNDQVDTFVRQRVEILAELAEDLSFGIRTLRMRREHRQETEERLMLATVVDQTSDGIITFDVNGVIQYVNPSFVKLCGVPEQESLGVRLNDFECPRRNPDFHQAILKVFAENKSLSGHFINKRRDGTTYDIDARIAPVFDVKGEVIRYVATVRDVSQEVVLQRQLRQAQKMEALATLSGGIAHDFNNILAIIITNIEIALEDLEPESPLQPFLDLVLKAGLRGKKLVKQFLTFSRQSEQPKKPIQLGQVILESLTMLRATLPSTIELRKNIDDKSGWISADPTQIHQVIMNLCTNAADAMKQKGGVLDISLGKAVLGEDEVRNYPGLAAGSYLKLVIADTGHGMSRDVLERIFDPFFTTKTLGSGTGLGLSIAHGIIKNHGGSISANSIVEIGTTFVILLPEISRQEPQACTNTIPAEVAHQERILFVDDEKDYASGMKMALERHGYQVTIETDSSKTLERFKTQPDRFDLVITDQTMPHLTGVMLAEKLLAIRPDMPIILCSGSSPEMDAAVHPDNINAIGIRRVLTKPVERKDILLAIENVLNPAGGPAPGPCTGTGNSPTH